MATVTQTLSTVGPIKPVSVGRFVEFSNVIGVEATQSTRLTQNRQVYDIYVLQAGTIRNHFSGLIAPRETAPPFQLAPLTTSERRLYHRYWSAVQARDLGQLCTLYHPDAVSIAIGTGSVVQGYAAIEDNFQ
jgi:hypothetical protein